MAVLRGLAWASRGIRSPARDMMLTSLSSKDGFGRAFGVERACDNAGAITVRITWRVLFALSGAGVDRLFESCVWPFGSDLQ